jgi:uncharacterized protein
MNIFTVPVLNQYLLYSPCHRLAAVVDGSALEMMRQCLKDGSAPVHNSLHELVDILRSPSPTALQPGSGEVTHPLFLGLIPTRACNLACRYCGFSTYHSAHDQMSMATARAAIRAYFELLQRMGLLQAEIQFFGGEPFYAKHAVEFAVGYAGELALRMGIQVRFEVTTNGYYPARRAAWIADNFDTVTLSLDGPSEFQDIYRPTPTGKGSYPIVSRSARIFSEGNCNLVLRVCITAENVSHLPEIAAWIRQEFTPQAVCLEPLVPSALSVHQGISPPDPFLFGKAFCQAADNLAANGVQVITSGTEIEKIQTSFCPLGKDALIVSPDGAVNACYLLEEEWLRQDLDLTVGTLVILDGKPGFSLSNQALERVRSLNVDAIPACQTCLCHYHCAGGCHVNHRPVHVEREKDRVCQQTRLVTIARLLQMAGATSLRQDWLNDEAAQRYSVVQASDLLL